MRGEYSVIVTGKGLKTKRPPIIGGRFVLILFNQLIITDYSSQLIHQ